MQFIQVRMDRTANAKSEIIIALDNAFHSY